MFQTASNLSILILVRNCFVQVDLMYGRSSINLLNLINKLRPLINMGLELFEDHGNIYRFAQKQRLCTASRIPSISSAMSIRISRQQAGALTEWFGCARGTADCNPIHSPIDSTTPNYTSRNTAQSKCTLRNSNRMKAQNSLLCAIST